MNKKKVLFCKMMASGIYTPAKAVGFVWYGEYEDDEVAGKHLMDKSKITKRITQERDSSVKMSEVDSVWIKSKLVELVEQASNTSAMYDPNVVRFSLDMLNKMNGNYEKDNHQRADVSLTMSF